MQYFEVSYALSNRVKCQNCGEIIHKQSLKIAHVYVRFSAARYDRRIWYHIDCLPEIPKDDRGYDLEFINLQCINTRDQQKIRNKLHQLKSGIQVEDQQEIKFLSKQEFYDTALHKKQKKIKI